MRCPHCRQQLVIRFRGRALFVTIIALAMVICIFVLLGNSPYFSATTLVTRFVIIIIGWFLLEAATAVFYFNFAKLIPRADPNAGVNR